MFNIVSITSNMIIFKRRLNNSMFFCKNECCLKELNFHLYFPSILPWSQEIYRYNNNIRKQSSMLKLNNEEKDYKYFLAASTTLNVAADNSLLLCSATTKVFILLLPHF